MSQLFHTSSTRFQPVLIEGYASRFDEIDGGGDRVQAGAFAGSLRAGQTETGRLPKMLFQHRPTLEIGRWTEIREDQAGLYVRGLITSETVARRVAEGLNGLSIGFRTRAARPRPGGGRDLTAIDLVEISLVREPMLNSARLQVAA